MSIDDKDIGLSDSMPLNLSPVKMPKVTPPKPEPHKNQTPEAPQPKKK